jgi:serine/threonine protein kinase/Tfp pilus assembly protein PilF
MIGKTILHYKILEKLGEGGMGVVYKAEDTKLDRTVAIKFLPHHIAADSEERERFIIEAKAAASLNHPNIATIHYIEELDDPEAGHETFIVMEYIQGKELKHRTESGPLPVDEALDIAIKIGEGLQAAHEQDIVHRDIKSSNIMLTDKGRVKVMDFGLAKVRGVAKMTKQGTTLGTTTYMSPEQARGEEVDRRTDIWSLGIILYEMISGKLPFTGDYEQAVFYSIFNEEPEPLTSLRTGVSKELERIVSKSLAKNPAERYQHIDEMLVDLRALKKEEESGITRTRASVVEEKTPKSLLKNKIVWISAAGLILFIALLVIFRSGNKQVIDNHSIAVLPFENINEDKDSEYFSDGITEDIITQLSKISSLSVISRSSIMQYKNTTKNLREIGSELNVANVLQGTIRQAGDNIRIAAQLVDVSKDKNIWAETYDRHLEDIFAIQSDVARQIATALQAELTVGEKQQLDKKPTDNLTAYEYYLKGRQYYGNYSKQDNDQAIELFKKALELDQDYALAYAGLGDAYGQMVDKFGFSPDWADSAIAASKKSIQIDPGLAEGYKALGLAYFEKGWNSKALKENLNAVEHNANYAPAIANIGWAYGNIGKWDEGMPYFKKVLGVDPLRAYNLFSIGNAYFHMDDSLNAIYWLNKALELQPSLQSVYEVLSLLYLSHGDYEKAIYYSEKLLLLLPKDFSSLNLAGLVYLYAGDDEKAEFYLNNALGLSRIPATHLSYIYWKTNRKEQARKLLKERQKSIQKRLDEGDENCFARHKLALIHAILGNKKEAYRWLQKAIDSGWCDYRLDQINPVFETLHNEKQFKQMMAEVKARVDQMRRKVAKS